VPRFVALVADMRNAKRCPSGLTSYDVPERNAFGQRVQKGGLARTSWEINAGSTTGASKSPLCFYRYAR
jgi:hypothetical protein